jgi:hypothetical protein
MDSLGRAPCSTVISNFVSVTLLPTLAGFDALVLASSLHQAGSGLAAHKARLQRRLELLPPDGQF